MTALDDWETCDKCGDELPAGKMGMHYRIVHTTDCLFIHNDPEGANE